MKRVRTEPKNRLSVWLCAIRIHTLPAAAVPVLVASTAAYLQGSFRLIPFLAILAAALLIQIGTNFANDVFDFQKGSDSDARQGFLRVTQAGLVSPKEMKCATALVLGLAMLLGVYLVHLGGLPILIIGLLSLAFALLYTAGPFPLSYTGVADFFVLIFFGPVAVGGTYYIFTGTITLAVVLIGTALGCISTAILVVNNLRDIPSDQASGKKTLAVRFGARFAKSEYLALLLIGGLIPIVIFYSEHTRPWTLLPSLYLLPSLSVIKTVFCAKEALLLNKALEQTGKLLVLFGLLQIIGFLA